MRSGRDKSRLAHACIAAIWLAGALPACEHGDIILGTSVDAAAPVPVHDSGERQNAGRSASASGASAQPPQQSSEQRSDAAVAAPDAGVASRTLAPMRASTGCGNTTSALATSTLVAGVRADFLLDLPAAYDNTQAYPLLLAFRGMSTSAERFRAQLDLASATADQAIRVHANPVGDAAGWEFQRDMPLVDQLIAEISAVYCVDLDRVFAIGDGAGALFANLVGCVRADKVRGIALLASAPPPPGPCIDNTAIWLLQQVDAEPMLVSAGLGNRDFWAARNACTAQPSRSATGTSCRDYPGCTPAFPVRYCEHEGDALPSFAITDAWAFLEAL